MPAELERCVKEIMQKQNVAESRAWAICKASMDAANNGIVLDKNAITKATIDESTGFLTAPVTLARVGVQYYMGYELGLVDRAFEKIGVYRSPEEVFDPESVLSYTNLVATNDHPNGLVTTSNVKNLQVGSVSEVTKKDSKLLGGIVTVTDETTIKDNKKGKIEVSVGYTNDLIEQAGEYNGEKYEFAQTNIRANHLAIVDAGRCGSACKITMDDNKRRTTMFKVTVDGITFDTENEQLAQAIGKEQAAHDAEKKEYKEKLDKEQEEKEKAMKEKDEAEKEKEKATASKDAALKEKLDDATIDAMVSERAELLANARIIVKDELPECDNCPKEMKLAVIDKVLGKIEGIEDKTQAYIDASYDIAIDKWKKAKSSHDSLSGDLVEGSLTIKDVNAKREASRKKYMADMGFETEGDSE